MKHRGHRGNTEEKHEGSQVGFLSVASVSSVVKNDA